MPKRFAPTPYGLLPGGAAVDLYTLENARGAVCKVITYGAIITEIHVPDRRGVLGDVVLGFDQLSDYASKNPYFGAAIGRVGNRIAQGTFTLNGRRHQLAVNNGPNSLHGGQRGFDKVVWRAQANQTPAGPAVTFHYCSPDGEEGYPGNLAVKMTYLWSDANELRIDYEATTDQDTPINLTNHSYWNLAERGSILDHVLTLSASRYTPVDAELIPTGQIEPVAGGPMDFTLGKPIGRDLWQLAGQPQGYDHNYVIDRSTEGLVKAAHVADPASGRRLEVFTDQPGVQFYSGNFLDGSLIGKKGAIYDRHGGFCLETQHFPDAVHHPEFPSTLLRPGETFRSATVHRFSAD
jgi:aldose 1-epimerase